MNSVQLSDYTERIKSTPSIAAKLSRQRNLRLSQIQDIVGLRFVVDHLAEQDKLVQTLLNLLADTKLKDRRTHPTFGYRAVHLIVQLNGKPIEIQVRSYFQYLWAQFSEMLADREGHALKYGGGDVRIANFMLHLSAQIAERENELLKMGLTLTRQTMEEEVAKHLPPIEAQS